MRRVRCALSHVFCSGAKSANEAFVQDITKWTFQETLVLRIDNTTHHRVGETFPRETYTTNDHIVRCLSRSVNRAADTPSADLHPHAVRVQRSHGHLGTILAPDRPPTGIHDARPSHPHRAAPRVRCAGPIRGRLPRPGSTWGVQVYRGLSTQGVSCFCFFALGMGRVDLRRGKVDAPLYIYDRSGRSTTT